MEFLDRFEAPHPQEILLQRADEALRDPIAFGLPHEAGSALDADERDCLLEIVGQVVRAVVVAKAQPAGDPFADGAETFAEPWRIGSEYLAVRAHLPAPWQDILDLAYYSGLAQA